MLNATCFDNIRTKKKISNEFIIPSTYYKDSQIVYKPTVGETPNTIQEQAVPTPDPKENLKVETNLAIEKQAEVKNETIENKQIVSKYSLLGLQKKKEAEQLQKERLNQISSGPVKPIEYNNLISHWNSFAKTLNQNGEKIMYTYMVLDTPKLERNTILLEFPNQSSKEDFTKRQGNLLAYLRENLENFELSISISVAEEIKQKYAFTPEEKFEKLKEINPAIDLMRKLFELELN